jgi:AcrR family transcriptional regulator
VRKGVSYHHGDLRRALMDATAELVRQHGPEGFTLRAAAKLAGVSDAAPYHHFDDKEALLAAVAEEGFSMLHDRMVEAAQGHPSSPRERSQAMGVSYVIFAAAHPGHFRAMFTGSAQRREKHPGLAAAATGAFHLVREALVAGLSHREAKLSQEHLIAGSWAIVHGLAFLAIDGHLGVHGRDPERLAEFAWGTIRAMDSLGP